MQRIAHVTLVVDDYDEAIAFYVGVLGFDLVADEAQPEQNKRWVLVKPRGSKTSLLLAQAKNGSERAAVGNQTGGRVGFFLQTDDFDRDYAAYRKAGVRFTREPAVHDYGTVAVFVDLCGNLWDLIQFAE